MEVDDVKVKYVMVFGKIKADLYRATESTIDEMNKAYRKLGETAEKHGLKLLLWGFPLGMYDESVVVFDVGGSMDNYLRFFEKNFAILPFTNIRTHPIVMP